ncbi:MAG: ABC transporter ATP-binding protein [Chloroflexi bacterium]|nr:ABC transporter ATP-binding protein [Chloroflexota bacterium]
MSTLVEARDLTKSFGKTRAVQGISLAVAAGEAYGLVGPDGAGKTTAIRLLIGALTPDAGSVELCGINLSAHPDKARSSVGYLAQRFALYTDLSVHENLAFFAAVRGMPPSAMQTRIAELLGFVGLAGFENRLAGQLSGGMKQKLGLACAIVHAPKVLLLDEPTAGVDPVTRQDFWQLLIRLLAGGMALVVTTTYMDEAARCQRLGFMHSGRMLTTGSPRALTQAFDGAVLELSAAPLKPARSICMRDADVVDAVTFGDRLHLRVRSAAGPLQRLPAMLAAAAVTVLQLRPIAPTLEDVFIALLAEQQTQ